MKRRNFVINLGLAGLAYSTASFSTAKEKNNTSKDLIRPKHLSKGDLIGIVSPAGAIFESEPYQIAKESFEAMGLKVKFGKYAQARYGHLAGTDEERAKEFNQMFKDKEVKAVVALRGGSGSARILDKIDYDVIRKNPKIFLGYSDITALHLAIYKKTGLVTFHGPVAVSTWNSFSFEHFRKLVFEGETVTYVNPVEKGNNLVQTSNRIRVISKGTVTGELLGGNLSVLTSIMGTPYFPEDWKGKILYVEEVGEKIYAIDRMLTQLKLGGVLDQISGFVFGKCSDCDPGGSGYGSLTLEEVVDHYIKPLGIPAYSGAMIGHIDNNSTIPNGILAELNAGNGTLKLLNSPVN